MKKKIKKKLKLKYNSNFIYYPKKIKTCQSVD